MRAKREHKGDTQFLVFRVGSDQHDFATDSYKSAKAYAEREATDEGVMYELYAKIGQAVPIKTPPPVKWYVVVSEGM